MGDSSEDQTTPGTRRRSKRPVPARKNMNSAKSADARDKIKVEPPASEIEAKHAAVAAELDALRSRDERQASRLREIERERDAASVELANVQAQLSASHRDLEAIVGRAESRLREAETQNELLKSSASDLEAVIAEEWATAARNAAALTETQSELRLSQSQLVSARLEIDELSDHLATAESECQLARNQLAYAEAALEAERAQVAELTAALAGNSDEQGRLQARLNRTLEQLDAADTRSADMQERLTQADQDVASARANTKAQMAAVSSYEAALTEQQLQLLQKTNELHEFQTKYSRSLQKTAELEDFIGCGAEEIRNLKDQVSKLENDKAKIVAERTTAFYEAERLTLQHFEFAHLHARQAQKIELLSGQVTDAQAEATSSQARAEEATQSAARLTAALADSRSAAAMTERHRAEALKQTARDVEALTRDYIDAVAVAETARSTVAQRDERIARLESQLAARDSGTVSAQEQRLPDSASCLPASVAVPGAAQRNGRSSRKRVRRASLLSAWRGYANRRGARRLFDAIFYRQAYPDVAEAGFDAYRHYLKHGAAEGRNPNRMFNTLWYLEMYPDVKAAGCNPLIHYWSHGAAEDRDPHPLFSTREYRASHPEVARTNINPLYHFLRQSAQKP